MPIAAAAVIVALVGAVWGIAGGGGVDPGPTSGSSPQAEATGSAPPAPAPTPEVTTSAPAAAPPGPAVEQNVYTGVDSKGKIAVAVGIKDGRAAGYICDGKTVEAWLEGAITGVEVRLQSKDGKTVVTGTVGQSSVKGDLMLSDGSETSFSANVVAGQQGFYESRRAIEGINERIGWIVLPEGTVGIRARDGVKSPAPTLDVTGADPVAVDVDGVPLQVMELDGASDAIPG